MKIMTNKQYQRNIDKIMQEYDERNWRERREAEFRRELEQMKQDIWEIKCEIGKAHEPVCDCTANPVR